ncbi:phosphotransferase family protein [Pricia sp.]|uniref:phosphotransferase family protein n=1 Tax=Pricia sp. TaxID=2268138 RepID=UPI003592EEAB
MDQNELIAHLVKKGLLRSSNVSVSPLSGGVSSELFLLDDGVNRFVLKRALPKLKVKADWFADVKRNQIEQRYLKYVSVFLPEAVPNILYSNEEHHFFCMEMLENGLTNWKGQMLEGKIHSAYAKAAGKILGVIHNKSGGDRAVEDQFDTLANFQELRIEPYLIHTGEQHPALALYFNREVERLATVKQCLVHGDFSPKNILVSPERLVILDCEAAWYGDPVFDVAFLLNHFMLKALYLPQKADEFVNLSSTAFEAYRIHAKNLVDASFEKRLVKLLLLLMLARVDGKSPVEYFNATQKQKVRNFVYEELPNNISYEAVNASWLETVQL